MLSFAVVMLVWKTGNVQKIINASGLQLTLVTVCTADKFSFTFLYKDLYRCVLNSYDT